MKLFELTNKNIFVTGAGSGLGKAFAELLASAGGHVVCGDLDVASAQETALSITQAGHTTSALQVDVRSVESVTAVADQIARDFAGGGPRPTA